MPDGKNSRIRNTRDETVVGLDVTNGVYTMDMWIVLVETDPVFSCRKHGEWPNRFLQAYNTSSSVQR